MTHRTISVLIENNVMAVKPIAASQDREKLIDFATAEYMNKPMSRLREPGATVEITDLTSLSIREVELLD